MILACRKHENLLKNRNRSNNIYKQDLEYKQEIVVSMKELMSGGVLLSTITNIKKPHIIKNTKVQTLLRSSAIDSLSDAIRELGLKWSSFV